MAALITFMYSFLLLLPNLILAYFDPALVSLAKLALALLIGLSWHLIFPTYRAAVVLALPFFLMLPGDLHYMLTYHEPPTTHIFAIIHATTPQEASDYLQGRVSTLVVGTLASLAVWGGMIFYARHWDRRAKIPRKMTQASRVIMASCMLMLVMMLLPVFPVRQVEARGDHTPSSLDVLDEKMAAKIVKLKGTFPFGRFVSLAEFFREQALAKMVLQQKRHFRFDASQLVAVPGKQIYVMVIGEAGRPDRWGINGYNRPTSPLLCQRQNVHRLSDIITPWSHTNRSVPVMLTRLGGVTSNPRFHEKSIIGLYKEAGFHTYWISNQPTFGAGETSITRLAMEADEMFFVNPSNNAAFGSGTYDDAVLPPLSGLMRREEPKQFIVIHTLGSHDAYHRRYPASFDRFQPSLLAMPNADYHDKQNKAITNNAYDNSILYTDYILDSIISEIAAQKAVSLLLYSSDHGEVLFDDDCPSGGGHGGSTRFEFPVASFIWYSNGYASTFPEKVAQLKRNVVKRLTTENLFPSLTDAAAITFPSQNLSMSLLSPLFSEHPRLVNAPAPVNWDRASFVSDCQRVNGGGEAACKE